MFCTDKSLYFFFKLVFSSLVSLVPFVSSESVVPLSCLVRNTSEILPGTASRFIVVVVCHNVFLGIQNLGMNMGQKGRG